jgi:hypothetical protein
MCQRLHPTCHGQRWQAETTVSMIKRRLASAVNARSCWSQRRALMLKPIAHSILPLLCALHALEAALAAA